MAEILFIDDEPGILKSLRRSLIDSDWVCDFCDDPLVALKMIAENEYLVIVTDMKMPGMGGAELLCKARELSPLTTGIVLSAYADKDRVLEAVNDGHAWHYLSKPWECEELLMIIGKARTHSLQKREIYELNNFLEQKVQLRTKELAIREDILCRLLENEDIVQLENHLLECLREFCACDTLQLEAGVFESFAQEGVILLERQGLCVGRMLFSPENSRSSLDDWSRLVILMLALKQVQPGALDMDNLDLMLQMLEGGSGE